MQEEKTLDERIQIFEEHQRRLQEQIKEIGAASEKLQVKLQIFQNEGNV